MLLFINIKWFLLRTIWVPHHRISGAWNINARVCNVHDLTGPGAYRTPLSASLPDLLKNWGLRSLVKVEQHVEYPKYVILEL